MNIVAMGVPFHSTSDPGENLSPITVNVKIGSPACFVVGVIDFSIGFGKLICCWHADITRLATMSAQKFRPVLLRKFLTPVRSVAPVPMNAIVETTKDVSAGQSGCFALRAEKVQALIVRPLLFSAHSH